MFAVIRLRSPIGMKKEIEDTMKMLRLRHINNCVVTPETPDYKGMVENVRDFVTYGEIDRETLVELLKKRLRVKNTGIKRIYEKNLKEITDFDKFESFADELLAGRIKLSDFEKLQSVFKLTPPSKGFRSIKEHYPKGDLGYRGKEINELIERMI